MNLRCAAAPSSPPPPFSILFISSFFFLPLLYSPAWLLVYRCCLACSFNPWFLLSLRAQANAAPKQVRLAEISATGNRSLERRAPGCSAYPFFLFFPSSCCGKSLRRCHFIYFYFHKEKRKRRNMRHASLNTRYTNCGIQHALPCQGAAAGKERRGRQGRASAALNLNLSWNGFS
jgi:hypothetical protein